MARTTKNKTKEAYPTQDFCPGLSSCVPAGLVSMFTQTWRPGYTQAAPSGLIACLFSERPFRADYKSTMYVEP
jgi:hypothetical protein